MVSLRGWRCRADTTAVQQLVSRLWPHGSHPGGLGWEAATEQLPGETMLGEDGAVVGWAGVTSGELLVQALPEAARALLDWAVTTANAPELVIPVFDGDEVLRSLVIEAGFQRISRAAPLVGMFRAAAPEIPELPAGYRIRSMRSDEAAERVAVHRAAWRPITLPWSAGAATRCPRRRPAPLPRSISNAYVARGCTTKNWIWSSRRQMAAWRRAARFGGIRRLAAPRLSRSVWCRSIDGRVWPARSALRCARRSLPVAATRYSSIPVPGPITRHPRPRMRASAS